MSKRPAAKSAPTQASKPKRKPTTAVETSSESEPEEEDDEEYIFKAIPHHQHLQEQEEWNTVVNTKKVKREERYERKKEREAELTAAVQAEQERYRQQAATNPYANLLAPKPAPQYNAFGRKKLGPKVHKYVHSPEDEEEFVVKTNFEKVQQKKAERSSKKSSSQPSKPAIQIQSETDLINTIVGILDRSPEPYLPVAAAAAELAKLTKTSWQDTYKRQYGPIANFLTSHPDTFALIDGDKLFLKPRLEAFLQTTIGRPKKKKVKAKDDANNADGKKNKKNKQNGHVDGDDENEEDESEHTSSSSSSSSFCGRCCSTLFLLLLSLLLVAIICLVILSIKRITVEEAFTRLNRLLHPYIQRIQPIIKPYIDQLAVHVTSASQQIKERWVAFQSKPAS